MKTIVFVLITIVAVSCDRSLDASLSEQNVYDGSWLLVERGFSPGGGYITEPVSDHPAQKLSFINYKQIVSTLRGYEDYKFYTLKKDSVRSVLTFFKTLEDLEASSDLNATRFFVETEGELLKLWNEGCIEGCHLGFRRTDNDVR